MQIATLAALLMLGSIACDEGEQTKPVVGQERRRQAVESEFPFGAPLAKVLCLGASGATQEVVALQPVESIYPVDKLPSMMGVECGAFRLKSGEVVAGIAFKGIPPVITKSPLPSDD